MIVGFVWIFFVSGAAINLLLLARMDVSRLDFLDGILIGQAYYVIVPLLVFLLEGRGEEADLLLAYRPYEDLATTGILIGGMFLFAGLRAIVPRIHPASRDTSDPRMVATVLVLFVATGALSFLLSGLAQGGHWQESLEGALQKPGFLPIKYAANVARNGVFAVLLYRVTTQQTSALRAMVIGLALALADLFTTFNRITAVYLLIMSLLLLKRRPVRMAVLGVVSLAALSMVSVAWPVFRGLATARGYSAASFAQAWDTARAVQEREPRTLDATLNSVFESSNILVLNWIVENYGAVGRPYLAYAMFARPVTVLVPGSVWPGRPQNFGLELGDSIAHQPSLALNSTLYGESYANFGWFWPLGLSSFVLLWHAIYRAIAPHARVVQMMGAFAAIAMWRFDASFVGSAALLTGVLVFVLSIVRISGFKPMGRFYFVTFASAASALVLVEQIR